MLEESPLSLACYKPSSYKKTPTKHFHPGEDDGGNNLRGKSSNVIVNSVPSQPIREDEQKKNTLGESDNDQDSDGGYIPAEEDG